MYHPKAFEFESPTRRRILELFSRPNLQSLEQEAPKPVFSGGFTGQNGMNVQVFLTNGIEGYCDGFSVPKYHQTRLPFSGNIQLNLGSRPRQFRRIGKECLNGVQVFIHPFFCDRKNRAFRSPQTLSQVMFPGSEVIFPNSGYLGFEIGAVFFGCMGRNRVSQVFQAIVLFGVEPQFRMGQQEDSGEGSDFSSGGCRHLAMLDSCR